jgi:hypothetical protein
MTAKIKIKVGPLEVEYEGAEAFLTKNLPDLLTKLVHLSPQMDESTGLESASKKGGRAVGDPVPLATFLQAHNASKIQNTRFLATAQWLHRKGSKMLKTSDVSKALVDSHQSRLSNPADCLNQNVKKGYCEKTGNEFYVTEEGRSHLG